MKIAYFIMAHHKPKQLLRMMNAIYDPGNVYMIHADVSASDELHNLINELAASNENINVLPSRKVNWGGWSLVQVEIDAIRELLHIDSEWSYYINLSGQDFPLMNQEPIKQFLMNGNGANYLQVGETDVNNDHYRFTFGQYFFEDRGKILKVGARDPFNSYFDIKPYHGSQWRIITRDFSREAVDSRLALQLQDYFRYTFFPDENYFQTVIMNSPFVNTLVKDNKRILQFEKREGEDHEIWVHRPITFTKNHFISLVTSGKLFARKFDEDVDHEIFDLLDGYLAL